MGSPITEMATPYFEALASYLQENFDLVEVASEAQAQMGGGRMLSTSAPTAEPATQTNATQIWILICGFLVFWMQAGFAMLEAGAVRSKNTINILFKNVMDVCLAAFFYFVLGYGFAYGTENSGEKTSLFIGRGYFALHGDDNSDKHNWFFQFAFAATAATIVSGAVAERTSLGAYFVYSIFLTAFVYPVVVHWIWSGTGWLNAFGDTSGCDPVVSTCVTIGGGQNPLFAKNYEQACGMIDYAGSGVVHMVGGFAGLVGAIVVGPRMGRFETKPDGSAGDMKPIPGHNIGMAALGTLILWFGWYGFNCGSTLAFDGPIASKVAVTTTIAPAMACLTGVFFNYALTKTWDLGVGLNCILAGLVSITAPCSTVTDWVALFIGIIGAFVYLGASALLKKLKIDDPLDAWPVHGACGLWGCLAVGIFSNDQDIADAYSTCGALGTKGNKNGWQFATQLTGVVAIMVWTVSMSAVMFLTIKFTIGMRVTEEEEKVGLDSSEHGGKAYEMGMLPSSDKIVSEPNGHVEAATEAQVTSSPSDAATKV